MRLLSRAVRLTTGLKYIVLGIMKPGMIYKGFCFSQICYALTFTAVGLQRLQKTLTSQALYVWVDIGYSADNNVAVREFVPSCSAHSY